MSVLTENIVLSRTRSQDLRSVRKLNCWGSELKDVSIVRRLPNVEVLSLSINNITTLADFASCKYLQELYLRKNRIGDINEILYLTDLPDLKKLWMAENPCAEFDNYRSTVLKFLPNLEFLDNVKVTPDEVMRAEREGSDLYLPGEGDEHEEFNHETPVTAHPQTDQVTHSNSSSAISQQNYSPENTNNYSHSNPSSASHYQSASPPRADLQQSTPVAPQPRNQMIKSNSLSDYNLYNGNNMGMGQPSPGPAVHYDPMFQYGCSDVSASSAYHQPSPPVNASRGNMSSAQSVASSSATVQSSARLLPKGGRNRNANILSAVLCLIKELDYASLEVVDTTIHCRMEEMED